MSTTPNDLQAVADDAAAKLRGAVDDAGMLKALTVLCQIVKGRDVDPSAAATPRDLAEWVFSVDTWAFNNPDKYSRGMSLHFKTERLLSELLGGENVRLVPAGTTPLRIDTLNAWVWHSIPELKLDAPAPRVDFLSISEVHARWAAAVKVNPDLEHPLAPIVAGWLQAQPVSVRADRRRDKGILSRFQFEDAEVRDNGEGLLTGGVLDDLPKQQPSLPFSPEPVRRKHVPLIDLVDAAGVAITSQGLGSPLPLRLIFNAVIWVPQRDRFRGYVIITETRNRGPLTLGHVIDDVFGDTWRERRHWTKLKTAMKTAGMHRLIGWKDGHKVLWTPIMFPVIPSDPDRDAPVEVIVRLPPGSESGPVVPLPGMRALMLESGPKFCAAVSAHTLIWRPGTTRVRGTVKRGRPTRWFWARDPEAYPVFTREDRRRLAFGRSTKHRTKAAIDAAWAEIPGIVVHSEDAVDQRTGERGWRLIPDVITGESDSPVGRTNHREK